MSGGAKTMYLSLKELSERWGIPEKTIYGWILAGDKEAVPPVYRFGRGARRHTRFRLSDIEEIEAKSKVH